MRKILSIFILTAVLAALTIQGCSKEKNGKAGDNQAGKAAPAPAVASKVIPVKTVSVEGRTVERSVEATGALLPFDEAAVSSEVSGTVESISADLGDRVAAGQTLLVLDQREARLNLGDAEALHQTNLKALEKDRARLADATATFGRYDELFRQGMVSASQYDSAKTQLDVAAAQVKESEAKTGQSAARLDLASKRLSDTAVRSPIPGEVRKRFVSKGETVKDRQQLFSVVSTGTLKFRGTVSEAAAPRIKPGQPLTITVEAYRDTPFKGKVTRVSPAVDAETRTLEIEASVPNPKGVLKPGFFAHGEILTNREANVPFVPESAVYTFVGITKVFVIEGDKARERLVKTGVREGGMVEIIDKVKPGDRVSATNLSNLFDGAEVKAAE